jgi:uncharacterized RDD family membrane protein YckC
MDDTELEYVGFWARTGAAVIDIVILLAIVTPLMFAVYGGMSSPHPFSLGAVLINYVLPLVLTVALWVKLGATPGKLVLGARIVDADSDAPLTPGRATLRYLGYYVSLIPFGLGCFWVGFDRRKQGWHDKMANSVVVRPARTPAVSGSSPSPGAAQN